MNEKLVKFYDQIVENLESVEMRDPIDYANGYVDALLNNEIINGAEAFILIREVYKYVDQK